MRHQCIDETHVLSIAQSLSIQTRFHIDRSVADSTARPRSRRFDVGSIRLNGDILNLWLTSDARNLFAQAVRMAVEIQPVQLAKKCNCRRAEF
jgi:hypothetical protein